MLKSSLAVTTTQLVKDGNVMDITVIFNAGDLVTSGIFFPSKRMGNAVFNTLITRGDETLNFEELLSRRSHFTYDGIKQFFDDVISTPQRSVLKSFKHQAGNEFYLSKLYYLKEGVVSEGYCVSDSSRELSEAKFFPFKREADAYFSEVCGIKVTK